MVNMYIFQRVPPKEKLPTILPQKVFLERFFLFSVYYIQLYTNSYIFSLAVTLFSFDFSVCSITNTDDSPHLNKLVE